MNKLSQAAAIIFISLGVIIVHQPQVYAQQVQWKSGKYSGMWFWAVKHWARPDAKKNTSSLQINPDLKTANYCYNKHCWFYPITWTPDGGFNFTTDQKNYFEMNFDGASKINGRFWLSLANGGGEPDARIVFQK